jgi:hypothetical protein
MQTNVTTVKVKRPNGRLTKKQAWQLQRSKQAKRNKGLSGKRRSAIVEVAE